MAAVSLRQLARIIGVDDKSVRKAERAGVFGDAVRRDAAGVPGVVDLAGAIAAWERSGRQLRGSRGGRQEPSAAPPAATAPPAPLDVDAMLDDELEDDDSAAPDAAPPGAPVSPSLVEAQRLAMLERHRKLKLDNDEREGSLVPAERVAREAFEFARVLRENVMNVPGRVAAELAAEGDAARIHVRLEAALREALETTANTVDAPAPPSAPAPATTTAA
jgi:hypothetical protein